MNRNVQDVQNVQINLKKVKKIFFIGIAGIGISALAKFVVARGIKAAGVNDEDTPKTILPLQKIGIPVSFLKDLKKLPPADLYIYSDAWLQRAPEILNQARATRKPVLSYFEALGLFAADYEVIAISGTHGKTTTTAMVADILIDLGLDPTVIVGSFVNKFNSNFRYGQSRYLVVEACEHMRHFLNFRPKILIITNIEADHLDYYKNLMDAEFAFSELISQTSDFVICNPADLSVSHALLTTNSKAQVVDYLKYLPELPKLLVPGLHNRLNAAAALAAAAYVKAHKVKPLEFEKGFGQGRTLSIKSLSNFSGTWCRLEKRIEKVKGFTIYNDYAHHPTEIKASLQALRELYPKGERKIIIFFQPHLYSRTKFLFDDFVGSFSEADQVFLLPIYAAREVPDPNVSSVKLAQAINLKNSEQGSISLFAQAFSDFASAENFLKNLKLEPQDILVAMGAGAEVHKIFSKIFP
jgi:UDP-N-acetylmuramate--alanine ligase